MNLYEMLKARKVGWSNDFLTNVYAKAFGGSQPAEHEYTGAVPYTFRADGTPLLDWYIKGNMSQTDTSTQIQPQECGERTANLFDFDTLPSGTLGSFIKSDGTLQAQGGWNTSDYVPCNGNTFTLTVPASGVSPGICLYDSNKSYITGLSYNGNSVITVQSAIAASYIRFSARTSWTKSEIMLNEGSTTLTYEPYGYKIPISCGGTVNNIYIGANPLRKSLDGTVVDELSSSGTLTQRVDADGFVLPVPVITQIDTPTIPTANDSNTFDVNTIVKPSEVYIKYMG